MPIERKLGMHINLKNEIVEFTFLETEGPTPIYLYAEEGKEATVYKVLKGGDYFALKVFRPKYQNRRLLVNTKKLNELNNLEGLLAAERTIIDRRSYPDLIEKHPELNYSILMPWIPGMSWGRLIEEDEILQIDQYLQIAKKFLKVVCGLETRRLAHCDLSNNSFMIDSSSLSIQLIDLENIFASDMPRPTPDISYGTMGYRSRWIAENGLWGPESDRFASAILCAEIITWHNKEIRDNRARNGSFFDEEEIGRSTGRFHFMMYCLGKLNSELPDLFQKAWFSTTLDQCPTVSEWMKTVEKIDVSTIKTTVEEKEKQFTKPSKGLTQSADKIVARPKLEKLNDHKNDSVQIMRELEKLRNQLEVNKELLETEDIDLVENIKKAILQYLDIKINKLK